MATRTPPSEGLSEGPREGLRGMEDPGVSMVMETGPGAAERRLMLETRDWRDTETMLFIMSSSHQVIPNLRPPPGRPGLSAGAG